MLSHIILHYARTQPQRGRNENCENERKKKLSIFSTKKEQKEKAFSARSVERKIIKMFSSVPNDLSP